MISDGKNDPLDLSRIIIKGHAERCADFAEMLARLIDLRDDDAAELLRRRVIAEVNAISGAFKALAAGRIREPAEAAKRTFDRKDAGSVEASSRFGRERDEEEAEV